MTTRLNLMAQDSALEDFLAFLNCRTPPAGEGETG